MKNPAERCTLPIMAIRKAHEKALRAAEELCRRTGARLTPLRRRVLQLVLASSRPPTAYEILDQLRPLDASATPAGVYRSLEFLAAQGLVHRIESTKAFVACAMPEHAHPSQMLVCRSCGTVIEAEDPRVASATEKLSHSLGFALDHNTVELTGVCATCRA
jgi:Fur family zinc uptake transcriptional regulator